MDETYYNERIKDYEQERAVAALAMDICVGYIDFKNDRERKKAKDGIYLIQNVDMAKAQKGHKKILDSIKKIEQLSHTSSFEISRSIQEMQRSYRLNLTSSDCDRIADEIRKDPVEALRTYARRYMYAKQSIQRLEKEKEEAKNKAAERRKQTESSKTIRESGYGTYSGTSSYSSYDKYERTPIKKTPYSGSTPEQSKELIKEDIDKKIANEYGSHKFSSEEIDRITKLYRRINAYGKGYYSIDTLEKGIQIEKIVSKNELNIDDIMNLAIATYEVTVKELLFHNSLNESNELFRKIDAINSIYKYKEGYNKFMKYYSSLSQEAKKEIDRQITNNRDYNRLFGKNLVTPDALTLKVNNYVSDYLVKNRKNVYPTTDYYSRTTHATRYMDIDQIANLYKRLKYDIYEAPIRAEDPEEEKRIIENRKRELAQLQKDFAHVILTKTQSFSKLKDITKMDEKEQEKYFEEQNAKLASICKDIFEEEPIAEELKEEVRKHNLEGRGTNLKDSYEAKKSVSDRVYGISSIKKAFAQVTGKWARYMMLLEKEELNKEEQEELTNMFR